MKGEDLDKGKRGADSLVDILAEHATFLRSPFLDEAVVVTGVNHRSRLHFAFNGTWLGLRASNTSKLIRQW